MVESFGPFLIPKLPQLLVLLTFLKAAGRHRTCWHKISGTAAFSLSFAPSNAWDSGVQVPGEFRIQEVFSSKENSQLDHPRPSQMRKQCWASSAAPRVDEGKNSLQFFFAEGVMILDLESASRPARTRFSHFRHCELSNGPFESDSSLHVAVLLQGKMTTLKMKTCTQSYHVWNICIVGESFPNYPSMFGHL